MPPVYTFCFYFDFKYLTRGLALYESLVRQVRAPFTVWTLCLDDRAYAALEKLKLPQVKLIRLAELEAAYPDLAAVKSSRNSIEYFWTCKSSLPLYVLEHDETAGRATYLDSDLFFFNDPQPMFDEVERGSIAIVYHRFPPSMATRAKRGLYNVGFLSFRRDEDGLAALRWWRERCVEWCYDRVEPTRYAEQKYLDDWPTRFGGVVVLQHKGANVAPWNWMNEPITRSPEGALYVGTVPLIFFHFAGLRVVNNWLYDTGLSAWQPMPVQLRRWIYGPYLQAIRQAWRQARAVEVGAVLMDRVSRTRTGLRVLVESWRDGQIGWI